MVKELLARADIPGSTPGDAVFCFFVPFFFFLFGTADPADQALGSICILSLRPEFYFGKRISKALDLPTGQAYGQKKP